ncbi:DUF6274 family protein [Streptantibioticus parmotrematis]|uniref:DUF6274 family protein n=1 Tax=Streptantibioticus parmotrematis TaxID=2873249 RepID=UPI0033CDD46A
MAAAAGRSAGDTPGTPPRAPVHDVRALLRAHLAAAARQGHLTRHCPVCHRLLRLAMEASRDGSRDR